jgi:ABC-type branched-subunit amino acid transport system substrate-binding protein
MRFARFGFVLALCGSLTAAAAAQEASKEKPFFDLRGHEPAYVGPSGARLTPDEVTEVRIGYFGPADPNHPLYGNLWTAAQRAVEDANRAGGFHGKPFRLLSAWSDNPWGNGITQVTQLVYRDRVWAIVGGVDGPTTHLAEQVVVKARLPLVSPLSTDESVNLTNISWMFSLAPSDEMVAESLVGALPQPDESSAVALLSTNDHDARRLTDAMRKTLDEHHLAPRDQFEFEPKSEAHDQLVRECLSRNPSQIILIADAAESAELVKRLRQDGFTGRIVGSPACGRSMFIARAGDLAGEVVFPMIHQMPAAPHATDARSDTPLSVPADAGRPFTSDDYAALHVYDAVQLVTHAIQTAGLQRPAIAEALRAASPTRGLSGPIEWNRPGTNTRKPRLATLRSGQIQPWP